MWELWFIMYMYMYMYTCTFVSGMYSKSFSLCVYM